MKRMDILWKGIIEDCLDDFLRFFIPDADRRFVLSRKVEFLDTELSDIIPHSTIRSSKAVDKLIKLRRRPAPKENILIHVEVQDQKDESFEERLFVYFYRIRDRLHIPVHTMVILTGTNSTFRPEVYEYSCEETALHFKFKVHRLSDLKEEDLLNDKNPFAIAILTVLLGQRAGKLNDQELLDEKIRLAIHIIDQHFPGKKRHDYLNFLKCYTRFSNKVFTKLFGAKLLTLTNKTDNMGIEEIILEETMKEGIQKGIKKGRREGIQKGIQKGRREGRENLKKAISKIGKALLEKTNLSVDEITAILGDHTTTVEKLKASTAA